MLKSKTSSDLLRWQNAMPTKLGSFLKPQVAILKEQSLCFTVSLCKHSEDLFSSIFQTFQPVISSLTPPNHLDTPSEQRTPSSSIRRRNVPSNTNIPPRPPAPGIHGGGGAPRHHGGPFRFLSTVLTLPITVLGIGIRVVGVAVGVAGAVARAVLPAPIANALGGAGRALLGGPPQVDPTAAAVCFKTDFNENYIPEGVAEGEAAEGDQNINNNSIDWLQCGWRQALSRAHSEGRFLFVYLHSPQHQATESYCKDTLLDPLVLEKLNNLNPSSSSGTGGGSGAGCGFLCWGGDIRRSDAFALSASLRVGGYPYAAVLAYSGPRTRIISCAEGPLTSVELAALVQRALDDYSGLLWQERIEREQREVDRRLRGEQDAEYQRSLEADRERDRVREERERERREAEERERRAAEEVAAAERERAEWRTRTIRERREAKRTTLPPEPTPTTDSSIQKQQEEDGSSSAAVGAATTLVRVKLPSGLQQQRRFYACQHLQAIFDWVDTLEEVEFVKYSLASPYPRRVYKVDGGDGGGGTLEELGLVGQAVLLLQPEDD